MEDYQKARVSSHIPLFALDKNGHLRAFTDTYQPDVKAGWTLLSLISPEEASAAMEPVEKSSTESDSAINTD
jgi:hypothetical protein